MGVILDTRSLCITVSALLYQCNYLTAEVWANTAEIQPPPMLTCSQIQRGFFVIAEVFQFSLLVLHLNHQQQTKLTPPAFSST